MTVLQRLKVELSNKEYFDDDVYSMYLIENDLISVVEYDKNSMQYNLLATVIDVLEALANDIDLHRSVKTEFSTVGDAYEFLQKRIADIKRRMATIEVEDNKNSSFTMLYKRG